MTRTRILTIDRLVDHISTVPAVAGQHVNLFVRERIDARLLDETNGKARPGTVVLFVHGGYCPSTLAFDVPYRDYSWMEQLARAGFDVFCLDMTGYGRSSRPLMDDPRNLDPKQQHLLVPGTLPAQVEPPYGFQLVNSDSETDDIKAVVDFICRIRGVERIALIGWSGGGIRTGTFTTRYPELVEKLVILASSNYRRDNPDRAPELPNPGVPMTMQIREVGITRRWTSRAIVADQIEPGLPEFIWNLNVECDPVGATWGPGGLRAPTRTYWGWNLKSAATINAPVLIMAGEQDDLYQANIDLFDDLGSSTKAFLSIACATHFVAWEKQRRILHEASISWLQETRLSRGGESWFQADCDGAISPSGRPRHP